MYDRLIFIIFIAPPHGQPHGIFRGFISPFLEGGCCYARCMDIMVEDGPHIAIYMQCTTFECSLSVLADVSVL